MIDALVSLPALDGGVALLPDAVRLPQPQRGELLAAGARRIFGGAEREARPLDERRSLVVC